MFIAAIGAAATGWLVLVGSLHPAPAPPAATGGRPDAVRILGHADPAIQRALDVLGQAVNPVHVVGAGEARAIFARGPDAGAPPVGLIAFRAPGDGRDPYIYVNRDSPVYRDAARRPSAISVLKLAATLVHEQAHNADGDFAAYRMQADFVRSRIGTIPRRHREAARQYLRRLEARAFGLGRAEGMRRASAVVPGPGGQGGRGRDDRHTVFKE